MFEEGWMPGAGGGTGERNTGSEPPTEDRDHTKPVLVISNEDGIAEVDLDKERVDADQRIAIEAINRLKTMGDKSRDAINNILLLLASYKETSTPSRHPDSPFANTDQTYDPHPIDTRDHEE